MTFSFKGKAKLKQFILQKQSFAIFYETARRHGGSNVRNIRVCTVATAQIPPTLEDCLVRVA